jgi:hypothetical protein
VLKKLARQQLQPAENNRANGTQDNGAEHHLLSGFHLFRRSPAECDRVDDALKHDHADKHEYEHADTELLAAHPLNAQIELGGQRVSVYEQIIRPQMGR